jgi:hypothetical protein
MLYQLALMLRGSIASSPATPSASGAPLLASQMASQDRWRSDKDAADGSGRKRDNILIPPRASKIALTQLPLAAHSW